MLVCLMCQMKAGNVKNLCAIKHQWDFIVKLPCHPLKIVMEETQGTECYLQSHIAALCRIFCSSFSKKCTPIGRVCRMNSWCWGPCIYAISVSEGFASHKIWSGPVDWIIVISSWSAFVDTPGTCVLWFHPKGAQVLQDCSMMWNELWYLGVMSITSELHPWSEVKHWCRFIICQLLGYGYLCKC